MKLFWPVEDGMRKISCYWEDSNTSLYYKKWGWKHNGIDFAVNEGSNLYAIVDMTCYIVQENESGKWVGFTLDGLKDSGCLYGHLSSFGSINGGDKFKKGQLLPMKSGNTGYPKYSSGPHLHLGIWLDGFKDSSMGNYSDALGLFLDGEVLKVQDTKMNPDYGKSFAVKDNLKSPTVLAPTITLTETRPGASTYWLELYKRIKNAPMKLDYDYDIVNPGGYIELGAGESGELALVLKNTGKLAWEPYKVNLGIPNDQPSRLYDERWLDCARPCTVPHEVLSGGDVMFTIPITVPLNAKVGELFRLDVQPVVENLAWMKSRGIFYNIKVK